MKMTDTPLTSKIKSIKAEQNHGLSEEVINALAMAKNFKPSHQEEYSIPFNQSLDGFRGIRMDWAFDDIDFLPCAFRQSVQL
jgi:hypothetical protein